MNGMQFHLAVNHAAAVGVPLGLAAYAAARAAKSPAAERLALALVAVSGLLALPAYFSGEDAEHGLKAFLGAGWVKGMAHEHEEAAEAALAAALAAAAAAGAALGVAWKKGESPRWGAPAVLLTGLAATGLLLRACHLGGLIRHTELAAPSSGAAPAADERAD